MFFQPRPQGFSLKKWYPFFEGKALGTRLMFFFPVQDFNALVRYLNQFSPDQFLTAMPNFHLLVFLATCDMLPLKVSTASR